MAVTVAEVSALLTARDEMSQHLKAAQENVTTLDTTFKKFGGTVTDESMKAERALIGARREVEQLQTTMSADDKWANSPLNPSNEAGLGAGAKQAAEHIGALEGMVTRLVDRMAIMFVLKGTQEFIKDLFTAAEKTANLADTLELSTDKVQEFEYAAKQTGVSLGTVTNAADMLGRKLAKDDSSVANALAQLGLDTDAFFNADPGERFDQVAREIGLMGDKTERTGIEMALFRTDKIDPLIMKLGQLERAAHDAGVVLAEEDVKALDQAKKSMETTSTALEVLAAHWLVAAQNAAAYYFFTQSHAGLGPKDLDAMANTDLDPSKFLPAVHGAPGKPAVGAGPTGPMDPNKPKDLAVLMSDEKVLNDIRREALEIERQIEETHAKQLHYTEQITKLYDKEMATREKIRDAEQLSAVLSEAAAKTANMARFGVSANGTPLELTNTPSAVRQREMDALAISQSTPGARGMPDSDRIQAINNHFLDAILADAKAADTEVQARMAAAKSADELAAAQTAATRAAQAAQKYALPTKDMFPTEESLNALVGIARTLSSFTDVHTTFPGTTAPIARRFAGGGPTTEGPAYVHDNEYVVPQGGALVKGGGGTIVNITVQGNVHTMDATGKAAFAQQINEAVTAALRQGTRRGNA